MMDFTAIPSGEILPNGIVVIRLPHDVPSNDPEAVGRILYDVRNQVPESTKIVVMQHDTDILYIPEETLNSAGWARKI